MFSEKTNSVTEKETRDKQELFGHVSRGGVPLDRWLKDTYNRGSFYYNRYKNIAEMILKTNTPKKVLEIGSNIGDFIYFCAKYFPQHDYTMSDLSEKPFGKFSGTVLNFFKIPEETADRIKYYEFSIENIPFADKSYDLIIVKSSVHHLENHKQAFDEVWRCLKPGGSFYFFCDPVCLGIPVLHHVFKIKHGMAARKIGFNEHTYTIRDYLSFGDKFNKREVIFDEAYIEEFMKHHRQRKGFKKQLSNIIANNKRLLEAYLIYKFKNPIIFKFTK